MNQSAKSVPSKLLEAWMMMAAVSIISGCGRNGPSVSYAFVPESSVSKVDDHLVVMIQFYSSRAAAAASRGDWEEYRMSCQRANDLMEVRDRGLQ